MPVDEVWVETEPAAGGVVLCLQIGPEDGFNVGVIEEVSVLRLDDRVSRTALGLTLEVVQDQADATAEPAAAVRRYQARKRTGSRGYSSISWRWRMMRSSAWPAWRLREAGFDNVVVTSKTNDGGIDGRGILRIGLICFPVIFQWKRSTQRRLQGGQGLPRRYVL